MAAATAAAEAASTEAAALRGVAGQAAAIPELENGLDAPEGMLSQSDEEVMMEEEADHQPSSTPAAAVLQAADLARCSSVLAAAIARCSPRRVPGPHLADCDVSVTCMLSDLPGWQVQDVSCRHRSPCLSYILQPACLLTMLKLPQPTARCPEDTRPAFVVCHPPLPCGLPAGRCPACSCTQDVRTAAAGQACRTRGRSPAGC